MTVNLTTTLTDSDVTEALATWQARVKSANHIWRYWLSQADSPHALGREAEALVADKLLTMGYTINYTRHKEHFDLVVNGSLRVEVKATVWRRDMERGGQRGRYQACMRGSRADLVILMVRNGQRDSFFVIPESELAGQRSITIRTYDARHYTGRFSQYLEAWDLVSQALETAEKNKVYQLSFSE